MAVPGARRSSRASAGAAPAAATSSSSVASRPPSPHESTLLEKKENAPARPSVPSSSRRSRCGARRVRGVLDQREPARVAQLPQRLDRRRDSRRSARRRPPSCAAVSCALDVGGVDAEVVRPDDVGEHRHAAAVAHGGGGRGERDRRHDHLVAGADAGGEVGEVQRRRAVGDARRRAARRDAPRTPPRTPPCAAPWSASPSAACRRPRRAGPRSSCAGRTAGSAGTSLTGAMFECAGENGSPKRCASSASTTSPIPSGTRICGLEAELGADALEARPCSRADPRRGCT